MGTERKERPQQVVCCRAGNKTERLELEEKRERENFLPDSLTMWLAGFQGVLMGVGGWGKKG